MQCSILHEMCARVGVLVMLVSYCGNALPETPLVRSHIFTATAQVHLVRSTQTYARELGIELAFTVPQM